MRTHFFFITSALLLAACTATKPVSNSAVSVNQDGKSVQISTYTPVGTVSDPVHGKEIFLSYGPVKGENKVPANGVATIHVFEDKTSNVGIQLNINLPEEGHFFEAWALKPNAAPASWISLGHMNSVVGDVRHALKSEQPIDLSGYTIIRFTKESDDGNPLPSDTVVAEALLKQAKRTVK